MAKKSSLGTTRGSMATKSGRMGVSALFVFCALGLVACGPSADVKPGNTPTSEQTRSASPEQPAAEVLLTGEELTKAFEIPAGLSPEELGKTFIQKLSDWTSYGTVKSVQDKFFSEGNGGVDYLNTLTTEAGDSIASGLFVDDSEKFASVISGLAKSNATMIQAWSVTYDSAFPSLDKEPYMVEFSTDSVEVTSQSDDRITLSILGTHHVNLNNRMNPESPSTIAGENNVKDGAKLKVTVTFQVVNGIEKISDIHFGN